MTENDHSEIASLAQAIADGFSRNLEEHKAISITVEKLANRYVMLAAAFDISDVDSLAEYHKLALAHARLMDTQTFLAKLTLSALGIVGASVLGVVIWLVGLHVDK